MKNKHIIAAISLCSAVLLSSCGTSNTPSGTERDKEITTAASKTETTTSVAETETTAEATALEENTPVIRIEHAGRQFDERTLRKEKFNDIEQFAMYPYSLSFDTDDQYNYCFSPSGKIWISGSEFDMREYPDYPEEGNDIYMKYGDGNLLTYRGASLFTVRESSSLFSLETSEDNMARIKSNPMIEHRDYRSKYEILWKDPTVIGSKTNDILPDDFTNLQLAYEITDSVTVNAFVCSADETHYAILIDPAYMQGIPMLSSENLRYYIGDKIVLADSLLLYSFIDSAYADRVDELPENAFAYAEVTFFPRQIAWNHENGYEFASNYCELTRMHILDTFTDITEFTYPDSAPIIDTVLGDAQMSLYYGALNRAYSEIYTNDVIGIELIDLDFDGTPELVVSRLDQSGDTWWFDWKLDADVYRFTDTSVKKIGTLPLEFAVSDSCMGYYLGTGVVPDGSDAWFATFRESPSQDDDWGKGDYAFAIADDKIYFFPRFTRKPAGEDALVIGGEKQETDYFFMGMRIEPTVDDTNPISYDGVTYDPLLEWNGVTADFGGMYWLYAKARNEFCKEYIKKAVCIADGAFTDIITHHSPEKCRVFPLDENAFRKVAAQEAYSWCKYGNALYTHIYSFLH